MKFVELVAMLCMVFIVLSTTFPISSSIRTFSTSIIHNTTAQSMAMKPSMSTKSNRMGFSFPLVHRNHPEIERRFGSIEQQQPLAVAPIAKKSNMEGLYYVNFVVGWEKESIFAVFDTGSGFTWMHKNETSSSYKSLPCQADRCQAVPNNYCHYLTKECLFDVRYAGNSTSSGVVGIDLFYFFNSTDTSGPTIGWEMVFGTVYEETDYPAVMGVTGGALGVITGLDEFQFSACFPKSDKQTSYLRLGEHVRLGGESTPLVPVPFSHYAFDVNSITIEGFVLTNLTGEARKGGTFIFDTGAAFTNLDPVAMDVVVDSVKKSVDAGPLPAPSSGFELCYDTREKQSLDDLDFSIEVNGVGSLRLDFANLWTPYGGTLYCLAFKRSASDRTIYGARQMKGWNFGLDLHDQLLWIIEDADCSHHY